MTTTDELLNALETAFAARSTQREELRTRNWTCAGT